MAKSLVLTLGHNSSAILVEDGQIIAGYEEERFTHIKSDSSFPTNSIIELMSRFGPEFDDCYIGHWFTKGLIPEQSSKYMDWNFLSKCVKGQTYSLIDGFTHHDSHMLSSKVFADHYNVGEHRTYIVADGFGTYGEVITIYKQTCANEAPKVVDRFFGYDNSLGMLYQYATAFLGMKMHNHEYKMLGYEAHILSQLTASEVANFNAFIHGAAQARLKKMMKRDVCKDTDPLVNSDALAATMANVSEELNGVVNWIRDNIGGVFDTRILVAYYVQGIVERVMLSIARLHTSGSLVLSGGLFYNVKLNHLMADLVDEGHTLCVMPLAGDQGAGLGVYQFFCNDLKWPGHVFWGQRDLYSPHVEGISVFSQNHSGVILSALEREGMVNVVRGAMEFGPRSLCNTATLALPTPENVDKINKLNDRTTIMPMAPVMTADQANQYLQGIDQITGSLDYMIVTRSVRQDKIELIKGASHDYPLLGYATCRPQVTSDPVLVDVLNETGPLINTSFNYHGVPIVYSIADAVHSHKAQNENGYIETVILT